MASVPRGNALVAQSGGPTAVINNSVVGVIHEALRYHEIEEIYGSLHGIRGALVEEMIDLRKEDPSTILGLRDTPAMALRSVRLKLNENDMNRLVEVFKAHNIRYFFYIGGNDSQDTSYKVAKLAEQENYELVAIGIPKTVDNDLLVTDHCPGYPSVARYTAISVMDASMDGEALQPVQIIECMGRDAGWITASAAVAKFDERSGPHLIYLPERPFDRDQFIEDIKAVKEEYGFCVVAASEGIRDKEGNLLAAGETRDEFGHVQLGGVGAVLQRLAEAATPYKVRYARASFLQRVSSACVSAIDREEAYRVGVEAVRAAMRGEHNKMVTIVRESTHPYRVSYGLTDLQNVANAKRDMPDEFINEAGNYVTEAFVEWCRPLVGELPKFYRLEEHRIEKKLPHYDR